jgi:protocatechuate 3,4-dioxygenase beta subunit
MNIYGKYWLFFTITSVVFFCPFMKAFTQPVNKDPFTAIMERLQKKEQTVSDVLTDTALLQYHSLPAFRQIIKQYAGDGKLTLASGNEPGQKIRVMGKVQMLDSHLLRGALVYVYQTDHRGYYADTSVHIRMVEGDRKHARLFGYLYTDRDGSFDFETIKPVGYPGSELPAHIHIEIGFNDRNVLVSELRFDDDPRLTPAQRVQTAREGAYVAKQESKNGVLQYVYLVKLHYPLRDP